MDGYMIDVQYDGDVLRVHPKNKPAAVALAGADHEAGDVIVPRGNIASVSFKAASMLSNGKVDIRTSDSKRYQLHFRRKQQAGFEQLARDLGAEVQ